MINFKFYIIFLTCVLVNPCFSLGVVGKDSPTFSLPFSKNSEVFFSSTSISDVTYAFQSSSSGTKYQIDVFGYPKSTGKWQTEKFNILCPQQISCTVNSLFTIENTMYLILKSDKSIYITSKEVGSEWTKAKDTGIKDEKNRILSYNGPAFEFPGSSTFDKSLFICIEEDYPIDLKRNTRDTAKCFISNDNGATWNENNKISIPELYYEDSIKSMFYFSGNIHFRLHNNKRNISRIMKCTTQLNGHLLCVKKECEGINGYELIDINIVNGYLVAVWKKNVLYYFSISYDGIRFSNFKEVPVGEHYSFLFFGNSEGGLYIHNNKTISLYSVKELSNRNVGCEMVEENEPNTKMTHRFVKNENGIYMCEINAMESSIIENTSNKHFFVSTKEPINFKNACFIKEFEGYPDEQYIRLIKDISSIQIDQLPKKKEYEFYFPQRYENYVFNGEIISCVSTDQKHVVNFVFNTTVNKHFIRNFHMKEHDTYNVNVNEILHFQDCSFTEDDLDFKLPNGSIVVGSHWPHVQRFLLPQKINETTTSSISTFCGDEKYQINIVFNKGSVHKVPVYNGVAFIIQSPNYTIVKENIQKDETIDVYIAEFTEEKTLGLICPAENEQSIECFNQMYDLNYNPGSFGQLFADSKKKFFLPQRQLYHHKQTMIESTLFLNNDMITKLKESDKIMSLRCFCIVNYHEVQIRYHVAPTKSEAEVKRMIQSSLNDDNKPIYHPDYIQFLKNNDRIKEEVRAKHLVELEKQRIDNTRYLKDLVGIIPLLDCEKQKNPKVCEPSKQEESMQDIEEKTQKEYDEKILPKIGEIFGTFEDRVKEKKELLDKITKLTYNDIENDVGEIHKSSKKLYTTGFTIENIKKQVEQIKKSESTVETIFNEKREQINEMKKQSELLVPLIKEIDQVISGHTTETKSTLNKLLTKVIESRNAEKEHINQIKVEINEKFTKVQSDEIARVQALDDLIKNQNKLIDEAKEKRKSYVDLEAERQKEWNALKEKSVLAANKFKLTNNMQMKYLNTNVSNEENNLQNIMDNDRVIKRKMNANKKIIAEKIGNYEKVILRVDEEINNIKELLTKLLNSNEKLILEQKKSFDDLHKMMINKYEESVKLYNETIQAAKKTFVEIWNETNTALLQMKKMLNTSDLDKLQKILDAINEKKSDSALIPIITEISNDTKEKNTALIMIVYKSLETDKEIYQQLIIKTTIEFMETVIAHQYYNPNNETPSGSVTDIPNSTEENIKPGQGNSNEVDNSSESDDNDSKNPDNAANLYSLNFIYIICFIYIYVSANIL